MSPDEEFAVCFIAFFNSITVVPLVALQWAVPFVIVYGIVEGLLTRWKSGLVTVIVTVIGALPAAPVAVFLATGWPREAWAVLLGRATDGSRMDVAFLRVLFLGSSVVTFALLVIAIGMVVVLTRGIVDRVRERRALSESDTSGG